MYIKCHQSHSSYLCLHHFFLISLHDVYQFYLSSKRIKFWFLLTSDLIYASFSVFLRQKCEHYFEAFFSSLILAIPAVNVLFSTALVEFNNVCVQFSFSFSWKCILFYFFHFFFDWSICYLEIFISYQIFMNCQISFSNLMWCFCYNRSIIVNIQQSSCYIVLWVLTNVCLVYTIILSY